MLAQRYIRVTESLYPFSGLDKVPHEVIMKAAARGTRVHQVCEAIVLGLGEWIIDEEIEGYITSFKKWWKSGWKVLSIEQRFKCDELMITGQIDLIVESTEGAIIVDIKTPAKPSKTWPLQGSAYAYMARKAGYSIKGIYFLQLSKDGSDPKVHIYEDQFEDFKSCLNVFNLFYRNSKSGITLS